MIDTSIFSFDMTIKEFSELSIAEYNEISCYYDYDVERSMGTTKVVWVLKALPGKELTDHTGFALSNIPGATNNH